MRETRVQRCLRQRATPRELAALHALVLNMLDDGCDVAIASQASAEAPSTDKDGPLLWFTLIALNVSRPVGAGSTVLASVLRAVDPAVGDERVLVLLQELERLSLVSLQNRSWGVHAELTKHGVDVVEYQVPNPESISRPNLVC